jgi:hypothetical protein
MTPFDQSIAFLHLAINALVLWFIWHGPWRRSCQERYRQKLFEVRDELFDFAREGGISFSDPAYIALRANINGLIRFSHVMGVTRLAAFVIFKRYVGEVPKLHPTLATALSQVKGKAAKERLAEIEDKVRNHTVWHLLFASPQVLIAGPALYLMDEFLSKKGTKPLPAKRHPSAVILIEKQAREAYRSEAIKRRHDEEFASVT